MNKKNEKVLVGISVRTSFTLERNISSSKIYQCVMEYYHTNVSSIIPNKISNGVTFCAYYQYSGNYTGEYTYFIGEQVSSTLNSYEDSRLKTLTIPSGKYKKYTFGPGAMPDVCENGWNSIWNDKNLEHKRTYNVDFEVYDSRASDHTKIVFDIFVGVK